MNLVTTKFLANVFEGVSRKPLPPLSFSLNFPTLRLGEMLAQYLNECDLQCHFLLFPPFLAGLSLKKWLVFVESFVFLSSFIFDGWDEFPPLPHASFRGAGYSSPCAKATKIRLSFGKCFGNLLVDFPERGNAMGFFLCLPRL